MNWEIKNLMCDIKLIKEKLDDLNATYGWWVEDTYIFRDITTIKEYERYSRDYTEHRILNEQVLDLFDIYLNRFDELINRFYEIEKASSYADQSQDNA
ncbi:DUF1474 family protein [Staphylococcus aureus]|uniref:type II toxin-antitoxin system toxin TscT n=1 Tax=Staphylococcus aureus TaxID=1280 RepID=UPI00044896B2|nr:DUF1474 family protein [Staphylococcus aureus]EZR31189.1 hypothetical protein V143_02484 [Staphylococcus aureus ZTA09/03739-9HSA]EZX44587.1 hypothetical protein V014_02596 [Staphylococcus aureus C3489]KAI66167.1 hypothetical protein V144_02604 [Staphylococcus aureus ZTA09/03745-9HSA]KAI78880.1 hypothetical protein V141_02339 [Staphylococcus aureus ZTA10/02412-8HSA]KAI83222.1 hypothetical protein V145_02204 [Staphylococcus aureus ZTA11/00189-8HSA]